MTDEEGARLDRVCAELRALTGVVALGLGGSRASGFFRPDSDVDLVLLYRDAVPPDVPALRALAARVNDTPRIRADGVNGTPEPVVTELWEWGRWVNGGAWLVVGGRRVDWLYRSLDHCERTWRDAEKGTVEVDWMQHPPFGFASLTLLAEMQTCRGVADPGGEIAAFQDLISVYPATLRTRLLQGYTWAADFALRKGRDLAARGQAVSACACATRALWFVAQVCHAAARRYPPGEKRLFAEAGRCPGAPRDFEARANAAFASPDAALGVAAELFEELRVALGDAYRAPPFPSVG